MGNDLKIGVSAFDRASKVIKNVGKNLRGVGVVVDKNNRKFKAMNIRMREIGKTTQKIGRKMTSVGQTMTRRLSLPIAAAGGSVAKMTFDFEKSMNRVQALTKRSITGDATKAFKDFENTAMDLGSTTIFSASQVGDAMGFLAQAGFKSNEIMSAIAPTLDLAAAGNLGLAETADIASNIMGAFNIEAKEMGRVSDVMALATATSNTNITQLGEAMKDAAPIANKFGASLETTTAFAGFLGNIGIQGSKAGTTLKAIFTKLAAPSKKGKAILSELGVSVSDSSGKLKDINQIFKELGPQIGKLAGNKQLAVVNELFGLRGIAGASDLLAKSMKKGQDPIGGFVKTLENSEGAAADMAKTMNQGLVGSWNNFKSAFEGANIAFGKSGIADFFASILDAATSFFQRIRKTNPALLQMIGMFAGIVAVAGPLIAMIGSIVASVGGMLLMKAALGFIGISMGAILLVAAKVVAIVALFGLLAYKIIENWKPIKSFFSDLWNEPMQQLKDFGKMILSIGRSLSGGLIKGILDFAGFEDSNSIDEKLKAQGFTINDSENKVGAKQVKKQADNREFTTRTNNAKVNVDFKNAPDGTLISSQGEGDGDFLNVNNGIMGAF